MIINYRCYSEAEHVASDGGNSMMLICKFCNCKVMRSGKGSLVKREVGVVNAECLCVVIYIIVGRDYKLHIGGTLINSSHFFDGALKNVAHNREIV